MKKAVIIRTVLFAVTLLAFLSATVFAWSTLVEKTQPIMFYSGRLDVDAKLYKLIDLNYDGIDDDNLYEEITEAYAFTKLVPGQIISFKIEVENKGSVPGYLAIDMVTRAISTTQLSNVIDLVYTKPEDTTPTTSPLTQNLLFYKNKQLTQGEANKYTFMFQMKVKPTLGNSLKDVSLFIDAFNITLNQIES